MRISDWSSDVCSSDLAGGQAAAVPLHAGDALEHLLVLDRVVIAAYQAPRRLDWIQERQVGLLKQVFTVPGVAAVAVAEVDDAFVANQEEGAKAGPVLAAEPGVPLDGGPGARVVGDGGGGGGQG